VDPEPVWGLGEKGLFPLSKFDVFSEQPLGFGEPWLSLHVTQQVPGRTEEYSVLSSIICLSIGQRNERS